MVYWVLRMWTMGFMKLNVNVHNFNAHISHILLVQSSTLVAEIPMVSSLLVSVSPIRNPSGNQTIAGGFFRICHL